MKLAELSFACYLYLNTTAYDRSYTRFLRDTRNQLDFSRRQHREALLKWLNAWGCRQFAKDYHEQASDEIRDWFRASNSKMFSANLTLPSLSGKDLAVVEETFEALVRRTASLKKRNGREHRVDVGPTGASKILFALRPLALIPWDEAIREGLRHDGSGRSYVDYLRHAKDDLRELERDCQKKGHELPDVPGLLGRPNPSLTKLVGEYYWVTVSQRWPMPSEADIRLWTG
jgi:hypothetical protein